jgi:hypothetical protein
VFAEFMNRRAAPLVRPLAMSPWVQNAKNQRFALITFCPVLAWIGLDVSTAGRRAA